VAGGGLGVLKQLGDSVKDNPTVMGASVRSWFPVSTRSMRASFVPVSDPVKKEGGIAILFGNLCPRGRWSSSQEFLPR